MNTTTVEKKTEEAIRPAKRWRNRWRLLSQSFDVGCGQSFPPGERYGARIFPSKDLAETAAMRRVEYNIFMGFSLQPQYLGAFPIEGEP